MVDRFEQDRIGLPDPVTECHGTGDLECHIRAVDVVVFAVVQLDLDVDDVVSRQGAL